MIFEGSLRMTRNNKDMFNPARFDFFDNILNRVPNPAAGRMSCISANGVSLACSPFAKQGMVLTLHRQEKVSGSEFLLPDG